MEKIQNKFFDLIIFLMSFIVSFIRSILSIFWIKKNIKKWSFFKSLDFLLRIWPNNFWKNPSFLKIWLFLSSGIKYIFYNKPNNDQK